MDTRAGIFDEINKFFRKRFASDVTQKEESTITAHPVSSIDTSPVSLSSNSNESTGPKITESSKTNSQSSKTSPIEASTSFGHWNYSSAPTDTVSTAKKRCFRATVKVL